MLNVSWDPVLIALSFLVAFIASFVALDSAGKIPLSGRKGAMFWRIAGGVTLGIGIWAMHFIGMLSMQMPMIMSYHLWLTLASLGVAVLASTLAINIAVPKNTLSLFRLALATLILSSGVVAMHYVGMAALMIAGFAGIGVSSCCRCSLRSLPQASRCGSRSICGRTVKVYLSTALRRRW